MSDQLDHVERPTAPWRSERLTECGLDDRRPLITRAEFYDRVASQGQQRAALSICMTCWSTAQRHSGGYGHGAATRDQQRAAFVDLWDHDPAAVMSRDLSRYEYAGPGDTARDRLNRELHVIALLVESHRAEFDAALAGMDEATGLDALRAKRAAQAPKARRRSL